LDELGGELLLLFVLLPLQLLMLLAVDEAVLEEGIEDEPDVGQVFLAELLEASEPSSVCAESGLQLVQLLS